MSINIELIRFLEQEIYKEGLIEAGKLLVLDERDSAKFLADFLALDVDDPESFKAWCFRYDVKNMLNGLVGAGYLLLDALEERDGYISAYTLEVTRESSRKEIKNAQKILRRSEKFFLSSGYFPEEFFKFFSPYVESSRKTPKSGARRDSKLTIKGKNAIGGAAIALFMLLIENPPSVLKMGALQCVVCGAPLPRKTRGKRCPSCLKESRGDDEYKSLRSRIYARAYRRGLTTNDDFATGWKAITSMAELDAYAEQWGINIPEKQGRKPKVENSNKPDESREGR